MNDDDHGLRADLENLRPTVDVDDAFARVQRLSTVRRRNRLVAGVSVSMVVLVAMAAGVTAVSRARDTRPIAELRMADAPPTPGTTVDPGLPPETSTAPPESIPVVGPEAPPTTSLTSPLAVSVRLKPVATTVAAGSKVDIESEIQNQSDAPLYFTTTCSARSVQAEAAKPASGPGRSTTTTTGVATTTTAPVPTGVTISGAGKPWWSGEEGTLSSFLAPENLSTNNAFDPDATVEPTGVADPSTRAACSADTRPTPRSIEPGGHFTSRFVFDARLDPTALGRTQERTFRTTFWYSTTPGGPDAGSVESDPVTVQVVGGPARPPEAAWLDEIDRRADVRDWVSSALVTTTTVAHDPDTGSVAVSLSYANGAWELTLLGSRPLRVRFDANDGHVIEVKDRI